jgi:ribonuclease HI
VPVALTTSSSKIHNQIAGRHHRLINSPNTISTEIYNINLPLPLYSVQEPQVTIETWNETLNIIQDTIQAETSTINELTSIAAQIQNWDNIHIYTDGSMENFPNCKTGMGLGMFITNNMEEITFSAQTKEFPSSTRAELVAILCAILVSPKNKTINLYTDSANAIKNLEHPKKTQHRWNKQKNPTLIQVIIETTQAKQITINFIKVKGHSGNYGNDKADIAAQIEEPHNPVGHKMISIKYNNSHSRPWTFTWQKTYIDLPIQHFVKQLNQSKWQAKWRTQNRINKWLNKNIATNTDWKTS